MRVLLIKTSSMGDVIHTLPALTDAGNAIQSISFDWLVEDAFSEIPPWHPLVDKVIPVSLRRWRKGIFSETTRAGWKTLRHNLHEREYDLVLDAQGLIKSAFLSFFAKGKRAGLDWCSARESLASIAYQKKCKVNFYQHAIVRMRQLFSSALGYKLPESEPVFGLNMPTASLTSNEKYVVFLHGTTWESKQWPETYWMQLTDYASREGFRIKIGGGNPTEVARAERIAAYNSHVDVMPYLDIKTMAGLLAHSQAAVAVDTGFGHLAAALDVPTVSIYGSTNPDYTGALGKTSMHLAPVFPCSPCVSRICTYKGIADVAPACYITVPPSRVWETVQRIIRS
jgi:heptosyltransferase-1